MNLIKSNAGSLVVLLIAIVSTLLLAFSGGCNPPVVTEADVEISDTAVEDTTDVTEEACVEADATDDDTDAEGAKDTCPQIVIVD